jgi:hypothetical protein
MGSRMNVYITSACCGITKFDNHLTHSLMGLSPSWEAANCAATQELPSILWNQKVHYHVHKTPTLIPILSQINLIHNIPSYLSGIQFNIIHPPTSWSYQWSLSFWFSQQWPICIPLLPISCYKPCPISSFLTGAFWLYLEKSTSYEAPHYVIFFNLRLLHHRFSGLCPSPIQRFYKLVSFCLSSRDGEATNQSPDQWQWLVLSKWPTHLIH